MKMNPVVCVNTLHFTRNILNLICPIRTLIGTPLIVLRPFSSSPAWPTHEAFPSSFAAQQALKTK